MNYRKNYYEYAEYVKTLARNKKDAYYESHHIHPRCLGGSDSKENLVLLTPREHFLAHYLLCKMYEGTAEYYKLLNAFVCMRVREERQPFINSRLYNKARHTFAEMKSAQLKGKRVLPEGFKHSIESKEKISQAQKKLVMMWNDDLQVGTKCQEDQVDAYISKGYRRGGHNHSEERRAEISSQFAGLSKSSKHRSRISEALKGRKKSSEAVEHQRQSRIQNAKPVSEETRKKLSQGSKERVWIYLGDQCKMCRGEELEQLLSKGWKVGRHD